MLIEAFQIEERTNHGFSFENLGGWAPLQGEGYTNDGRVFYFRIRYNYASLEVWAHGAVWEDEPELVAVKYDLHENDPYLGALEGSELVDTFCELVDKLAPRSPENKSIMERISEAVDMLDAAYKEAQTSK